MNEEIMSNMWTVTAAAAVAGVAIAYVDRYVTETNYVNGFYCLTFGVIAGNQSCGEPYFGDS